MIRVQRTKYNFNITWKLQTLLKQQTSRNMLCSLIPLWQYVVGFHAPR